MNIRANRYNDPALGAAFENIASLFAPASAQDTAAYATASAKKAEAERLAKMFSYANDPNYSRDMAERMAFATGQVNGTNGYYAQDQNNATTIRGQDVTAATSRANNTADNTRTAITSLFGPLNQGQMRPELPAGVGGLVGLPALPGVEGLPKPMSLEEQKAKERADLRGGGTLTDEMLLDGILGADAPVKTVGPTGNPIYSTPGAAARTGAQAYVDAGSTAKKELYAYTAPDGRKGSAAFDPTTGMATDEATGARLPAGTRYMKLEGEDAEKMAGTPSNVTLGQRTVAEADYGLSRLKEYRDLLVRNKGVAGLPGSIRGFAQDVVSGVGELAAAYGTANIPEEKVRELAAVVGANGSRDPAIRAAAQYAVEMAYSQAKMGDPGGEVNVREFERLLGLYAGGIGGNEAVLEALAVLEGQFTARKTYGQTLQSGPSQTAAPAAPAPAPAAPPAGGTTRMRFDAEGNPIP